VSQRKDPLSHHRRTSQINTPTTTNIVVHESLKMADNPSLAWPIADEALAQQILTIVQQASHYRQLKKGANESESPTSLFI
jgi:hypothetical protein